MLPQRQIELQLSKKQEMAREEWEGERRAEWKGEKRTEKGEGREGGKERGEVAREGEREWNSRLST